MRCTNCGSKIYNGYCTWCHEEAYIAEQYTELDEPIPKKILDKVHSFERERRANLRREHRRKKR